MFINLREILAQSMDKWILQIGCDRAFAAGADVVALVKLRERSHELFKPEYLYIDSFAKHGRTISVWKGIVMGGGLGISCFSTFRVATNSTTWAMPESAIGLVNDVGSNYVLSHMRSDAIGLFLGITGHRLNGADCYYEGLATHYILDE
jgi:enoyl-CoA hydratase/carnithine racemase